MGFKRKADPAEVEEIEDEEEARLGSQFPNHPQIFLFVQCWWESYPNFAIIFNWEGLYPKMLVSVWKLGITLPRETNIFCDMGWLAATGGQKTTSAPTSTEGTAMGPGGKMESWRDFVVKKVSYPT